MKQTSQWIVTWLKIDSKGRTTAIYPTRNRFIPLRSVGDAKISKMIRWPSLVQLQSNIACIEQDLFKVQPPSWPPTEESVSVILQLHSLKKNQLSISNLRILTCEKNEKAMSVAKCYPNHLQALLPVCSKTCICQHVRLSDATRGLSAPSGSQCLWPGTCGCTVHRAKRRGVEIDE